MSTSNFVPTPAASEYFEALVRLGIFAVDGEEVEISEPVRELFTAVHQVLAGATLDVKVVTAGAADVADDLEAKLQAALDSANMSGQGPDTYSP